MKKWYIKSLDILCFDIFDKFNLIRLDFDQNPCKKIIAGFKKI